MPASAYQRLKSGLFTALSRPNLAKNLCPSGLRRKSANNSAAWGCGALAGSATPPALAGTTSMGTHLIGAPFEIDMREWLKNVVGDAPTSPEITISKSPLPEPAKAVLPWHLTSG